MNQNSCVHIDAIGNDGKKDSYYGVIEEIWELDYGPFSLPMGELSWRRRDYRPVWDVNSGLQKDWI
jgi:hypothetical protein